MKQPSVGREGVGAGEYHPTHKPVGTPAWAESEGRKDLPGFPIQATPPPFLNKLPAPFRPLSFEGESNSRRILMLIGCMGGGGGWVERASLFVRWWSWSGTPSLWGSSVLSLPWVSYGLVTRWVTWSGRKDTHRRCVQRTLEVFKIPPTHHHHLFFQMQAAGPAGWMVFRYPELHSPSLWQAGRLILTQQPPV